MQVIMFDRQSIFIHGMKISLQQHIPGISIQSVGQAEELWQKIESAPDALVMLDSGLDAEFCREVLQRTAQQFPEVKIIYHGDGWQSKVAA
ncbi:LuxR family transcriptional regulator [Salmonella enterica subsp. enterica]|nr:LuxR family transcriptional regulator [Salmonella enterica subsp. enterica]